MSEMYYRISTTVTPTDRHCTYTAHKHGPPYLYCMIKAHALQRTVTELEVRNRQSSRHMARRRGLFANIPALMTASVV